MKLLCFCIGFVCPSNFFILYPCSILNTINILTNTIQCNNNCHITSFNTFPQCHFQILSFFQTFLNLSKFIPLVPHAILNLFWHLFFADSNIFPCDFAKLSKISFQSRLLSSISSLLNTLDILM